MIGIYYIRHIISGMCYVGQSIDIERRIGEHFLCKGACRFLYHAIRKHGKEAFESGMLELCPEEDLEARERFWIAALNTLAPNGYNLKDAGSTGRFTEEVRKQIGETQKGRIPWNKGKKTSKEVRQKLSESHKGKQTWLGKKHKPESREKMSVSQKNRKPFTAEHRQRLSESAKRDWQKRKGKT